MRHVDVKMRTLNPAYRFMLFACAAVLLIATANAAWSAACMDGMCAKKGNPSYVIGQPLPENVEYAPVPPRIMVSLGNPPKGYAYGIVGEDILLISLKNRRVAEALALTPDRKRNK